MLAGLARSKTQSGLIPGSVLDELIGTYCLHLTTRFDSERGKQHIRDIYVELLRSQFWRHPDSDRDVFVVSEAHYANAVEGIKDEPLASLTQTVPAIFSHTDWEQTTETQMSDQEWHRSLGALLKPAVTAHRVALDLHAAELQPLDLDVVDDAKDACHQLLLLAERVSDQYERTVGSYHQTPVYGDTTARDPHRVAGEPRW